MEQNATKIVPTGLLQAVVDYLALRPYNEVHELLGALLTQTKDPDPTLDQDEEESQ
jgi:hypothetical protein